VVIGESEGQKHNPRAESGFVNFRFQLYCRELMIGNDNEGNHSTAGIGFVASAAG
jgi:hypothetical protein